MPENIARDTVLNTLETIANLAPGKEDQAVVTLDRLADRIDGGELSDLAQKIRDAINTYRNVEYRQQRQRAGVNPLVELITGIGVVPNDDPFADLLAEINGDEEDPADFRDEMPHIIDVLVPIETARELVENSDTRTAQQVGEIVRLNVARTSGIDPQSRFSIDVDLDVVEAAIAEAEEKAREAEAAEEEHTPEPVVIASLEAVDADAARGLSAMASRIGWTGAVPVGDRLVMASAKVRPLPAPPELYTLRVTYTREDGTELTSDQVRAHLWTSPVTQDKAMGLARFGELELAEIEQGDSMASKVAVIVVDATGVELPDGAHVSMIGHSAGYEGTLPFPGLGLVTASAAATRGRPGEEQPYRARAYDEDGDYCCEDCEDGYGSCC